MSERTDGGGRRLLPFTEPPRALEPTGHCAGACGAAASAAAAGGGARDDGWLRAARWARRLALISLAWMCVEGGIGLWQGLASGSISLTGWALGSVVEGLASVIVVWRFTGSRMLS